MFKYLPTKDELLPITNENSTFYECGFNVPFDDLPFIKKLQIINDVIRQTLIPNGSPNPNTEQETLIGNCQTAAIVSIEYLKSLGIGKNHRMVFCQRRPYDPPDVRTTHAAVLVDDNDGNTYFFDATPYVASNYGKVLENTKFYEHVEIINGEKFDLLFFLKELKYKGDYNLLEQKDIPFYVEILSESLKYQIFQGYISKGYEILYKFLDNKSDSDKFVKEAIKANPYSKLNPERAPLIKNRNLLMQKQIAIWREELADLLRSNTNFKRQLELAQNIYQELKVMDNSLEINVPLFGKNYKMTHMTPKFFKDYGLNTIMIKPSAYYAGVSATIRERFLHRGHGALYEYSTNLTAPTPICKILPMLFSHTLGDKYVRAMNGKSTIILLQEKANVLYKKKKELRNELCKNMWNRNIKWSDGEDIYWHKSTTNLIHSTDSPSEASMHFMMGYPEQQIMTRFMYPNPKLEEELEK